MKNKWNKRTVIKTLTLIITVFLLQLPVFSQTTDRNKLTLVYDQISMVDLLDAIEEQSDIYFSYSPDDFDDRFFRVKFHDRSIEYVLNQIFNGEYAYVKNANEFILYKIEKKEDAEQSTHTEDSEKAEQELTPPPETHTDILRIDTVYQVIYDTLIKNDTIFIRDTIMVRDTIYKQKVVKNAHLKGRSFENTLVEDENKPVYYLDVFYSPVIGSTVFSSPDNELNNAYTDAFTDHTSYAYGLRGGVRKEKIFMESGLSIRKVSERFEHTVIQPEQIVYETDTLDSYYTVSGSDTTWYHITDSTQNVIPGYEQYYKNTNEYMFLDIPVFIGYMFHTGKLDLEMRAGMTLGVLVDKQGYYIADEVGYPARSLEELDGNLSLSGGGSVGLIFRYSKRFGLFGRISMKTRLIDPFHNSYPVNVDRSEFSIKLGIRAYL